MSVDPKELERITMAKMASFASEASALLKADGMALPSPDADLEERAKNKIVSLISDKENLIVNVMNPDQSTAFLKGIPLNLSKQFLNEIPPIHATANQILGQIYLEALRRSQPSVKQSNAPVQASTPKPVIPPTPERRQAFLLEGLKNLSLLDENATTEPERKANRIYNRHLKNNSNRIQRLIRVLSEKQVSDKSLFIIKDFLDKLNAVHESMAAVSREYSRGRGFEDTQQKSVMVEQSPEVSLQTSTLKLRPVPPSPYLRLNRDDEGNFVGINPQGAKENLNGKYSFVVMPDEPMVARLGNGHSAISQAKNVLFAGETVFTLKDGKTVMQEWTNDSGHYATDSSTGHHAIYVVDSAGKPLFESDKFAIRAETKPMNFAPPSPRPPAAMPIVNKPNPATSAQSPTTASSSSTPSINWAARMNNLDNDFKESRDTYNNSGLFTAYFNVHTETQPSLREIAAPMTQQEPSAANISKAEQRPTTPRL